MRRPDLTLTTASLFVLRGSLCKAAPLSYFRLMTLRMYTHARKNLVNWTASSLPKSNSILDGMITRYLSSWHPAVELWMVFPVIALRDGFDIKCSLYNVLLLSGIGKRTAFHLARMGGRVIMACRSLERGEKSRQELEEEIRCVLFCSNLQCNCNCNCICCLVCGVLPKHAMEVYTCCSHPMSSAFL